MVCQNVGSTNSDIAGLGILLSFIIQGAFSVCLSVWVTKDFWSSTGPQQSILVMWSIYRQSREFQHKWIRRLRNRYGQSSDARAELSHDQDERPLPPVRQASPELTAELSPENIKRRQITIDLLFTISDAQLFNGISLLVSSLVQYNTLGLYHLRVVYETVNFTGEA